jgi:ubiquinone/menaquinone biosynthesis C-methylase UbiE
MTEASTVSCYDAHATAYDTYQFAVVPGYPVMLDLAADACKRYLVPEAKMIDLGCGTGNASLAVLKRIPAKVFLIDGSQRMVNLAVDRLSRFNSGSLLGSRVADLSREDWDHGLADEKYDAVVSTLVLEHLPFDCYKATIAKCFRLLNPGGWLLAAEGYMEEDSDMQEWFFEEMEVRRQGLDRELSDYVASLRNEQEMHYYCSKEEKAGWWRVAGFERVNVLWQYLCIALMAGRKPL